MRLKKYLVNISWLFSERLFRIIMAFWVGVAVTRFLGPEDFGKLSFALSFISLFAIFSSLGLEHVAVRELVKHPSLQNHILGSVWKLKALGTFCIWIIVAVTIAIMDIPDNSRWLVGIISINFLFYTFTGIDYFFQSKVQGKITAKIRMIALFVVSLTRLLAIWLKADVTIFAALFVVEGAIITLGLVYQYQHRVGKIANWCSHKRVQNSLLKNALPLILSGLAVSIFLKIDQVMLQLLIDETAVGEYAAAVKITEILHFVSIALTTTFFPAILAARKTSLAFYHQRLQQFYDLMVWAGLTLTLIVSVFARPGILLLYGESFSNAGGVLLILSWSLLFVFMAQAGSRWFLAENRQHHLAVIHVIAGLVNILINWILIPKYGIIGAAIATVISYAIAGHAGNLIFAKDRQNFMRLLVSLNPIAAWKRTFRHGLMLFKNGG